MFSNVINFSCKPAYKCKYGTHLALDIIMDFAKKKKQAKTLQKIVDITNKKLESRYFKKIQKAKNVTL